MFGEGHKAPKPPRYEPYLLLLLAVLIALVLTVGYALLVAFGERASQPVY